MADNREAIRQELMRRGVQLPDAGHDRNAIRAELERRGVSVGGGSRPEFDRKVGSVGTPGMGDLRSQIQTAINRPPSPPPQPTYPEPQYPFVGDIPENYQGPSQSTRMTDITNEGLSDSPAPTRLNQLKNNLRFNPDPMMPAESTAQATPTESGPSGIGGMLKEGLYPYLHGLQSAGSGMYNEAANLVKGVAMYNPMSPIRLSEEAAEMGVTPLRNLAAYSAPQQDVEGVLPKIISGATRAPFDIAKMMVAGGGNPILGAAITGALQHDPADPLQMAVGAAHGAAMIGALKGLGPMSTALRIPTGAGIFGGLTALEGGDIEDIAAQAVIGGGLSAGMRQQDPGAFGREANRAYQESRKPNMMLKPGTEQALPGVNMPASTQTPQTAVKGGKVVRPKSQTVGKSEQVPTVVPESSAKLPIRSKDLPVANETDFVGKTLHTQRGKKGGDVGVGTFLRGNKEKADAMQRDVQIGRDYKFKHNIGDKVIDPQTGNKYMVADRYIQDGEARYTVYPPSKKKSLGHYVWIKESELKSRGLTPKEAAKLDRAGVGGEGAKAQQVLRDEYTYGDVKKLRVPDSGMRWYVETKTPDGKTFREYASPRFRTKGEAQAYLQERQSPPKNPATSKPSTGVPDVSKPFTSPVESKQPGLPVKSRQKLERAGVVGKGKGGELLTQEQIAAIDKTWEKRRREWIDKEREKNPNFAPDIESRKELLTKEQLAEVNEYEQLRYKSVAYQGKETGYKPYKLTTSERNRLTELHKKYKEIYYEEKPPIPKTETTVPEKGRVETPKQAVQEIIDGKRESTIGTAEFKKRMLAELDKAIEKAPPKVIYKDKLVDQIPTIRINIPGDGDFNIPNTLEGIKKVRARVKRIDSKTIEGPYTPTTKLPMKEGKGTSMDRAIRSLQKVEGRTIEQTASFYDVDTETLARKAGYKWDKETESWVVLKPDVEFTPAKPSSTELGALGTPETFKAVGETVTKGIVAARKATDKLMAGVEADPVTKKGVLAGKELMIDHDRQVRWAESTHQLLKKTYNDFIPDAASQKRILNAVNQPGRPDLFTKLSPQEQGAARWMIEELNKQREYNRKYEIVTEAELPVGVRYIKGWYKNPETGKAYSGKYGKFSKGLPEAHQKKYPTYESAEKAGIEAVTYNLGDIVGEGWESLIRAHAAREMFNGLAKIQADNKTMIPKSKGKRPSMIIEDWGVLSRHGLTGDYVRATDMGPNVRQALERRMAIPGNEGNVTIVAKDVGVHKAIADHVRAYVENPTYGKLSELNFMSKSLKLGVSVFHPMMLGWQEAANLRIPFKNIPRGLKIRKELGPEVRLLHQEGLELFKGYEDVGYRNRFFEGSNIWSKAGNIVTKPVTIMRDFIFDIVQPGMKISFAFDKLHLLLPKYLKGTGITPQQAIADFAAGKRVYPKVLECARDVVRKADGHFSGEHYKRALLETNRMMVRSYFSPEVRKAWQASLISPTWQREHLLVAKDVAKSLIPNKVLRKMGMREIGPIRHEYQKYLGGALGIVAGVNLYNYMMTEKMDGKGKHLWQNPDSYGFAVRAPWNSVKGEPVYFRPLKSLFEVAEFLDKPRQKFSYKLAPWISVLANIFWPDHYHKEVKEWGDVPAKVGEVAEELALPISASQWKSYAEGYKSPESAAMNTLGFPTKIYRPSQDKTRVQKEVVDLLLNGEPQKAWTKRDKWNRDHPNHKIELTPPRQKQTTESKERIRRKDEITTLLLKGDTATAKKKYETYKRDYPDKTINWQDFVKVAQKGQTSKATIPLGASRGGLGSGSLGTGKPLGSTKK